MPGYACEARHAPWRSTLSAAETFRLERTIPLQRGYDLVVAGGGPAGCGAAIAAARLGARVLLVEASGCLGGMGTSALVSAWSHLSNGRQTVIGGLMLELVEAMYERGHIAPSYDRSFWTTRHDRGLGYDPEGYKRLLDQWCEEAGVEVRYFTKVIDAQADASTGRVGGVVVHGVEGYAFVVAEAFVDATGDAVLADLCGVASRRAGRDTERIMPPTLCAVQTGIDYDVFERGLQQAAIDRAIEDGFFDHADRHLPGLFRSGPQHAIMNAGHLFGMDALDGASLSEGMRRGRALVAAYTEFFRRYVPGCEAMTLVATAALMGVRESRRVVGEYELDVDDYRARRHFHDQIAVYCKQVDVHVYDDSPEEYERYRRSFEERDVLAPGESYGIPYGVLVPRGWANLWVAGRCASSDVSVHGAIRDQPACVMMGQAAGTAAVQALRSGERADALDTRRLVESLRAQGAHLPQAELDAAMTRRSSARPRPSR